MESMQTSFTPADMQAFEPSLKIGLLATTNPAGQPHLTLITSLLASTPSQLAWGQFLDGSSKTYIQERPQVGWLIMSLDKRVWRGQARWTHCTKSGREYDFFNNVPMFRYNAYFGVHTVHYMDVVAHTGRQPLPMRAVVNAALQTALACRLSPRHGGQPALNAWTRALWGRLDGLKFLSYVGASGFPEIIPLIQAQPAGSDELLFSPHAYGDELARIPTGADVALLGMTMALEAVTLRARFNGFTRRAGVRVGSLTVQWVYNPMPPCMQQIYPPPPLQAVHQF